MEHEKQLDANIINIINIITTPRITGSQNAFVIASDNMIDSAYHWVCSQRRESSHNNSVWDLRYHWTALKPRLQKLLREGQYRLSPLQSYCINGEWQSSWTAMDALVLKALSLTLQPLFTHEQYAHCTHLKDAGGIHAALKQVSQHQHDYQHILKSDAYHYYESINHQVLLAELEKHVTCPVLLHLVSQYCDRTEIKDGHYDHFQRGIPKGCPLSPLMAAVYLKPLDDALCKHGFYVGFMDDWIIMVKSKHALRKVIKLTHSILNALQLKMHPDKTYIGRIKKGFDFLGVHFGAIPLIAKASLDKHRAQLAQRYAQGASPACIGDYVARWTSWCSSVLRASGSTNHNQTNLLEHRQPFYPCYMGRDNKETSDEKINTPCGTYLYAGSAATECGA